MVAIRITDPDPDPHLDTGKTCLGGGMHCRSASHCLFYADVILLLSSLVGGLQNLLDMCSEIANSLSLQ